MPTINIIGYLWHNRQALDLDGLPDVLEMVADLQRLGLECVRAHDVFIMGSLIDTPIVELITRTSDEWAPLVENIIVSAAAQDASHMHGGGNE